MEAPFKMYTDNDIERFRLSTWDEKEPETIVWLNSMQENSLFLDVGANVGIYTLYFKVTHPEGKVYAFEPSKQNYRRLFENIVLNGFKNVIPLCFGIGAEATLGRFYEYDIREGASGGQVSSLTNIQRYEHASMMGSYCVIISLDIFMALDELRDVGNRPIHVKIDIDGQESSVIKGMYGLLDNPNLYSVLVELDPLYTNIPDIVRLFRNKGFTINNEFNALENHSRVRRLRENILCENVIFTRGEDNIQ